jgi:hypothetical protein
MSENNKKSAPKPTDNDDLLGGGKTDAQLAADKAAADKAAADKAAADKAAADKAAAKPKANKKKIGAAQGDADNDYLPEEKERHLFHVKMEKKVFSPSTGKKLTKDFVQKYNSKEWSAYQKNGGGLGFTCTVLWNPENFK